ncbi:hypothetical protein ACWCXE_31550 [Streptomyces sp. NPDC001780]
MTDPRQPITGTADSSTEGVTVMDGNNLLGDYPVSGGTWTCVPTKDWTGGSHTVSATAWYKAPFDEGYGHVDSEPRYVAFDVPLPPPAAPVISSPLEGATVTEPRQQVTGTADPGVETVTLTDEGNPPLPGEAHVTGTTWTYTPTTDWTPGPHTITATAHRSGLHSPPSAPRDFSVRTPSSTVSVELVDPLADHQAVPVDYAFTHRLDVHITENDDDVRMLPITFTINGSTGSEFGTGATTYPSRTDDNGVAAATTLYAGDKQGSFTVTVTSPERADVHKDIHLTVQPRS